MKTLTIRFSLGATDISIEYIDRYPNIFRTKSGHEQVGINDRVGWLEYWDGRLKLYRSQIDHTLWLDRKGYQLEKRDLPTQAGIYCLGPSYWPPFELIRELGLQRPSPRRELPVEFGRNTAWTTAFHRRRNV